MALALQACQQNTKSCFPSLLQISLLIRSGGEKAKLASRQRILHQLQQTYLSIRYHFRSLLQLFDAFLNKKMAQSPARIAHMCLDKIPLVDQPCGPFILQFLTRQANINTPYHFQRPWYQDINTVLQNYFSVVSILCNIRFLEQWH